MILEEQLAKKEIEISRLQPYEEKSIIYEKAIKSLLKRIGKTRSLRMMKELRFIKKNFVTGEVLEVEVKK